MASNCCWEGIEPNRRTPEAVLPWHGGIGPTIEGAWQGRKRSGGGVVEEKPQLWWPCTEGVPAGNSFEYIALRARYVEALLPASPGAQFLRPGLGSPGGSVGTGRPPTTSASQGVRARGGARQSGCEGCTDRATYLYDWADWE